MWTKYPGRLNQRQMADARSTSFNKAHWMSKRSYGQLLIQAVAIRTATLVQYIGLSYAASAILFDLFWSSGSHLFSTIFWLMHAVNLVLIIGISLYRLKTLALNTIFSFDQLILFGLWIVHGLLFGFSYTIFYTNRFALVPHPQGKQRHFEHQLIISLMFWLVTGVVGYFVDFLFNQTKIVSDRKRIPSLMERLSDQIMMQKLCVVGGLLVGCQLLVTLVLSVGCFIILGRFTMICSHRFFVLFTGALEPFKFSVASLLDFRLLGSLVCEGLFQNTLWLSIRLIMSHIFSSALVLTSATVEGNASLLEGLSTPSPSLLIQEQALCELVELLNTQPARRLQLYNEFRGDASTCKEFCLALVSHLSQFIHQVRQERDQLVVIEKRLAEYHRRKFSEADFHDDGGKKNVFCDAKSFSTKNIVQTDLTKMGITHRGELGKARTTCAITPEKPRMPSILATKPTATLTASPEMSVETGQSMVQPSMMVSHLEKLINSNLGRGMVSIWISLHKSRSLRCIMIIERLLEAIERFVYYSIDEDRHGQVQLNLDMILDALCEWILLLRDLDAKPDPAILEELNIVNTPILVAAILEEGLTTRVLRLSQGTLDKILDRFGDSLGNVNLSPTTKSNLARLGKTSLFFNS